MERKPNLGQRLAVGATFKTTTKSMTKDRGRWNGSRMNKELNGPLITYEVLKPGTRRWFTNGKRRYYCEVLALVEQRTGCNCWPMGSNSLWRGPRWWIFTYLVKVIEN